METGCFYPDIQTGGVCEMFLSDSNGRYGGSFLYMILFWQRATTLLCIFMGTAIAGLYHYELLPKWLLFPSFPLAVVGGALGIFVSFRTNSAYQRWWEGRKLWGRLINTSRHICTQALAYLPDAEAKETVIRQCATFNNGVDLIAVTYRIRMTFQ